MKALLLAAICGLFFQTGIAQPSKQIAGKVMEDSTPIAWADVINSTTNIGTRTNEHGRFSLQAAINDTLIIYSRDHEIRKIGITPEVYQGGGLVVLIRKKSVELDEVFVSGAKEVQLKFDQAAADQVKVERDAAALRVQGVYDGRIENGANFVRMFKDISKFAKKIIGQKDEGLMERTDYNFTESVTQLDTSFFVRTLKLSPEEIPDFINFCRADNASRKQRNVLELMDFLILKNSGYKKVE